MKPRQFLTKSIFKMGLECPRKLYYHNKPNEYFNEKQDDPFLQALARGGFQVGALAQTKFQSGFEIKTKNHSDAIAETQKLFQSDVATLFEAAFSFKDGENAFFVRSDIAIKASDKLRIIEVKSKAFQEDESEDSDHFTSAREAKKGNIKLMAKWAPYIYDLAFQVFVARKNYPQLQVSASLMLLDKTVNNPQEGLHQMFLVKQMAERGFEVLVSEKAKSNFNGHEILKEIDLTELVNSIIEGKELTEHPNMGTMSKKAASIAETYLKNQRADIRKCVGTHCKTCEFRGQSSNLKSGFDECWVEYANIQAASSKKLAFDLWSFLGGQKALDSKKYFISDLTEEEIGDGKRSSRQLIIVKKERLKDSTPWFDLELLKDETSKWNFPLHFIDFETCMPAIPFKKNFPPYSEIAFQFSHHVMRENGQVEHCGEFIDLTPGKFVTFDFLRALKSELDKDTGTIFRYSPHENSVINRAIFLLERSQESDKGELISFFKTITTKKSPTDKKALLWSGERTMVDLLEILKKVYYSPKMGNSNSIKYVLPAVIAESNFLKEKYSKPIYGTTQLVSKNFINHTWINVSDAHSQVDPYKELPPLFSPDELMRIENVLTEDESIRNGGAAMMAYCKTQFTEMSQLEREAIRKSLLKYCELDTLAMVMIVEYWKNLIS